MRLATGLDAQGQALFVDPADGQTWAVDMCDVEAGEYWGGSTFKQNGFLALAAVRVSTFKTPRVVCGWRTPSARVFCGRLPLAGLAHATTSAHVAVRRASRQGDAGHAAAKTRVEAVSPNY